MYAKYQCIHCIIEQVKKLIDKVYKDRKEEKKFNLMVELTKEVLDNSIWGKRPIEIATPVYNRLHKAVGNMDPFHEEKRKSNKILLELFDDLYNVVINSQNPLKTAAILSSIGNQIDYGIADNDFGELEWEIEKYVKTRHFKRDDFDLFLEKLRSSKLILYIHDNAGEIVLDKLFIRILKENFPDIKIISAVRSKPIINDVTKDDALQVKLQEFSEIIESGIYPGVIYEDAPEEFKYYFSNSDLIISKGQGNYEGLNGTSSKIFFILMAKCIPVAKSLNVEVGDLVFASVGEKVI